uniref:Putative secreted peptide n=1 Tax=Anopheles braziliensis TaxID=58242 RepID=A0A2M3ZVM9_9DIPT
MHAVVLHSLRVFLCVSLVPSSALLLSFASFHLAPLPLLSRHIPSRPTSSFGFLYYMFREFFFRGFLHSSTISSFNSSPTTNDQRRRT